MKNIVENGEVFAAYARIDLFYYMLKEMQSKFNTWEEFMKSEGLVYVD